jgi:hypothetical protein
MARRLPFFALSPWLFKHASVEGTDRKQATLFPECLDDWIDNEACLTNEP